MRTILALAFLLACVSASARPHVLFVAIDDLNDYISPLDHHPGIKTPHFDRLARRSVNFANAHCAAPACHPSRVAIMTGVHPSRSGIYRNMFGARGPRWRHESPLLEKAVVLSQHFRDHGYRAVGGGKIFHTLQWTPNDSQNDPEAWDDYRGDPNDPISQDWPRPKLIPDDKSGLGPGRPLGGGSQLFGAAPLDLPDEKTGDHMVVDWAIEQMKKKQAKPLFLAVGLFRPHIPWEVPKKWFDIYPLEKVNLPEHREDDLKDAHNHGRTGWHKWVVENKQWEKFMQGYLASITYVDHQLGRLSLTSFQFWGEKTPSHGVSDARYRYIQYGNGFEELYDLEADPREFTNRADDSALAEVKTRLAKGIPANPAPICQVPKDSPHHRANQKKK